jgi:hypothetical protein
MLTREFNLVIYTCSLTLNHKTLLNISTEKLFKHLCIYLSSKQAKALEFSSIFAYFDQHNI